MHPAMTFTFSLESSNRGYHEYQSIWPNATVDDELICKREVGNPHDTHAVAIKKDIAGVLTTVGHSPRKILVQGGLEIPCILTYTIDDEKEWVKTKYAII